MKTRHPTNQEISISPVDKALLFLTLAGTILVIFETLSLHKGQVAMTKQNDLLAAQLSALKASADHLVAVATDVKATSVLKVDSLTTEEAAGIAQSMASVQASLDAAVQTLQAPAS